jgi:hypothetical protein
VPIVPIVPIVRVALVAIVLAGCSAQVGFDASGIPSGSASASATPSPSPPLPQLTPAEQGRLYLASGRWYYDRLCRFNTRWAGRTDWRAKAAAIDKLADVQRRWADELREIRWARQVQGDIERLIRNLAAQEAAMRAQAAAPNPVTFWRLGMEVSKLNAKGAQLANAVRGTLGIESVGGDACHT